MKVAQNKGHSRAVQSIYTSQHISKKINNSRDPMNYQYAVLSSSVGKVTLQRVLKAGLVYPTCYVL